MNTKGRAFSGLLRTALRQQLQYRSAMMAGVVTQIAFGLIYTMVYQAFFREGQGRADLTLMQTVSYVWLSQGTYRMMPWSGLRDIETMMRDGRIAFELTRPRDLFGMWYARAMALRTAPLLGNLPLVLAAALLMPGEFALRLPIEFLPLGALSLLLAMLLTSAVTVALTGSYFWTISGQGINRIVPMLGSLMAGNVVPLGLFPAGVRQVLRALPFASMLDAPLRILVGAVNLQQALELVGLQMAWLIGLLALGRCVIHAGVRKCVVQGG